MINSIALDYDLLKVARDLESPIYLRTKKVSGYKVGQEFLVKETYRTTPRGYEFKLDIGDDNYNWMYANSMPLEIARYIAKVVSVEKMSSEDFAKLEINEIKYNGRTYGAKNLPYDRWFRPGKFVNPISGEEYVTKFIIKPVER